MQQKNTATLTIVFFIKINPAETKKYIVLVTTSMHLYNYNNILLLTQVNK